MSLLEEIRSKIRDKYQGGFDLYMSYETYREFIQSINQWERDELLKCLERELELNKFKPLPDKWIYPRKYQKASMLNKLVEENIREAKCNYEKQLFWLEKEIGRNPPSIIFCGVSISIDDSIERFKFVPIERFDKIRT